ncbi:MAG: hypothetical protein CMC15_18640 [Flavobacteriaceae bacterium]|nr:hypothetical protein [Flavobacteriaceae bacterium]
MTDYIQAQEFITLLTGDPQTVMDWRLIHDTNKGELAHNYRGSLDQLYQTLVQYNQSGWGVFCCINAMDGQGRELINVHHIRAHVVDMDNVMSSSDSYNRSVNSNPQPQYALQSSPNKYHVYWFVEPYAGNDYYTALQRKLVQVYDGDKKVIDASRVMRVPGFYHLKDPQNPHLIQGWRINQNLPYNINNLDQAYSNVNVIVRTSQRSPLGEESMSAPSLEWLQYALSLVDPNDIDRGEWLSFTAAFKQSGWNHASEEVLYDIWSQWCQRFSGNDVAENLKLWGSIKDSEVGWSSIERRTPVKAYMDFGFDKPPEPRNHQAQPQPENIAQPTPEQVMNQQQSDNFPEILDEIDCREWFKGCYFIGQMGKIFSPSGRFMNQTSFNGLYGGRHFLITSTGKTTDDAWKAALRSTRYTIPKVDHVRFLPEEQPYSVLNDSMGRKGLNIYIPAKIEHAPGDVSIWLDHVSRILPDPNDQKIWYDYLAYCVKFPGNKIPWAPLLQSTPGVGKTVFFEVMSHALGSMYVYRPKAQQLVSSGSKFNSWMRGKLAIMVDEIKVDERRELVEVLKPMITDSLIEIEGKGVDQDMEDNPANWIFFTNHKNAIPVNQNDRRYCVFYSQLSTERDLINAGMDKPYFDRLWYWLREQDGLKHVTNWLLNYPIEKNQIPVRAPESSTQQEAIRISRSPLEIVIQDCLKDRVPGFLGGYISETVVIKRAKAHGIRSPSREAIRSVLETMGYFELGRTPVAYAQEDVTNKSLIYTCANGLTVENYGPTQGYQTFG